MKKILFFVFLFLFIIGNSSAQELKDEELIASRDKIHVINLVNGLYLSKEQLSLIAMKARELERVRYDAEKEAKEYTDDYKDSLVELKKLLMKNIGEIPEDTARRYHQSYIKLEKIKDDYNKQADKIINEVKANLTGSQLYLIETYKPCIIPPKGQERIGQAESNEQFIRQLDKIRSMSAEQYAMHKERLTSEIVGRAKKHTPRGIKFNAALAKEKALSVFNEARSLSDVEFEVKKEFLAASLKADLVPQPQGRDVNIMIEKFLLNPQVIAVAEEKLATAY